MEDDRIGAITFTGSAEVGWGIRSKAPHKKINLELGSNAPLIVNDDGDWETAADKAQLHAYSHAGQSCISVQRILLHESIADQFTERFVKNVESLVTGDPMDENTDVGPVISRDDRDRVKEWIDEAAATKGKPTAIVANTIKGKGVSFMENNPKFHGVAPTADEVKKVNEAVGKIMTRIQAKEESK